MTGGVGFRKDQPHDKTFLKPSTAPSACREILFNSLHHVGAEGFSVSVMSIGSPNAFCTLLRGMWVAVLLEGGLCWRKGRHLYGLLWTLRNI